jgi:hypothetical protein
MWAEKMRAPLVPKSATSPHNVSGLLRCRIGGTEFKISERTQTTSAIIVAVKRSVEYAKLWMGMHLGNVRYSALCRSRRQPPWA